MNRLDFFGLFVASCVYFTGYLLLANWLRYLGGAVLPFGNMFGDMLPLFLLVSVGGSGLYFLHGKPILRLLFVAVLAFLLYLAYLSSGVIPMVRA